jgi:hypothetical protein
MENLVTVAALPIKTKTNMVVEVEAAINNNSSNIKHCIPIPTFRRFDTVLWTAYRLRRCIQNSISDKRAEV